MTENRDVIICRCEEVTWSEVVDCIGTGARTLQEVKMMTRAGMGACQGRVCRTLLRQLVPVEQLEGTAQTPGLAVHFPVNPVHLAQLGDEV